MKTKDFISNFLKQNPKLTIVYNNKVIFQGSLASLLYSKVVKNNKIVECNIKSFYINENGTEILIDIYGYKKDNENN